MTIATYNLPQAVKKDEYTWSPSGLLLLELIEKEIRNNGVYVYARENLSQLDFEEFTRQHYQGGGRK